MQYTAHNVTLQNAHEAYALMLLGELYCGQSVVTTPNTHPQGGEFDNCNVVVSLDSIADVSVLHANDNTFLYVGSAEFVFNGACKFVVCAPDGSFAVTNGQVIALQDLLIADFFGVVSENVSPEVAVVGRYSEGDEEAWRDIVRSYNVYGPEILRLFDEFIQVWVQNSPSGIAFLEECVARYDFTLQDFCEACCFASAMIMQDWEAESIYRGYAASVSCGNNIAIHKLSSWSTNEGVAQGFANPEMAAACYKKPYVFSTTIKDVQVLTHHAFCERLNTDLKESEVVVYSERAMMPALNTTRPSYCIGQGVDAIVLEQKDSPFVIVKCKNPHKAVLLDIFAKCNLKALPRVRKICNNTYEMERLYAFTGEVADYDMLWELSCSYKNIAKLQHEIDALSDKSFKEALQYLRKALRNHRYRLDLHMGNIMQRKNGDVVLVDPLINLKYTSLEWARKQAQAVDEAW